MARKRRRKIDIIAPIITGIILIVACFFIFNAFNAAFSLGKEFVGESGVNQELGEEVRVTIPQGASTKDIAEILKDHGLIDSVNMFRINSRLDGFDGTYQQGEYLIAIGTSEEAIMGILQSGAVYVGEVRVMIPEGYTVMQIAEKLEQEGLVTKEEFMEVAENGQFDYEFITSGDNKMQRLEGYLFPATYQFEKDITATGIINKMLERFAFSYEKIKENNNTQHTNEEILIIASIVEKEIQVAGERAIAAGVINNRLDIGMMLQIDATVLYALSTTKEVVTIDDTNVSSPYNMYNNYGLPPGAICNPGDAAIEAALNPASHKYIYYVVKERGSGEHVFTETYDEFLAAKRAYQNSFN